LARAGGFEPAPDWTSPWFWKAVRDEIERAQPVERARFAFAERFAQSWGPEREQRLWLRLRPVHA